MNQNGSLFFRLPRELRDDVYRYYSVVEEGFTYDPKHNRLPTTPGAKIDLALQYTCKRVASEMDGFALQLNTITFHAIPDHPCPATEHANAALFANLLKERLYALQHMVSWARRLVTPSMMAKLVHRYPEHMNLRKLSEKPDFHCDHHFRSGSLPEAFAVDYSGNYALLVDAVQLIADHPDFPALTAREYLPQLRETLLPDYVDSVDEDLSPEGRDPGSYS